MTEDDASAAQMRPARLVSALRREKISVVVAGGHALQSRPLSRAARTPTGGPVTTTAESVLVADPVSRSFGDSRVGHNEACNDLPDLDFHREDSSMDTVVSIGEVGRRALGRGRRRLSTCRLASPRWQPKGCYG